jgi:hypothetical protein
MFGFKPTGKVAAIETPQPLFGQKAAPVMASTFG